jgi:hypothetical protein
VGGNVVVVVGTMVEVVAVVDVVAVGGGSMVVPDSSVLVRVASALLFRHAERVRASVISTGRRRMRCRLWHELSARTLNLDVVFGPLNGVRTALVIAAVLAALVSLITGHASAAGVLMAAVAIHGLGWLYLYENRKRSGVD